MQRLAVREHAHQFLPADARPMAHIADVQMHEGGTRGWIVPDAAALHPQPDVAQLLQRHAGNEEIHGLAQHVLAFLRHALGAAAQHGVGGRRAIAADDLDIAARTALSIGFPHQVEQARVHLDGLVAAPVAQDVVDLLQPIRHVAAVALVDDLGLLVRVQVVELERADFGAGAAGAREEHSGGGRDHRRPHRPDDHGQMTPVRESFDPVQIKWPCRLPFVPGFDTTDTVQIAPQYQS